MCTGYSRRGGSMHVHAGCQSSSRFEVLKQAISFLSLLFFLSPSSVLTEGLDLLLDRISTGKTSTNASISSWKGPQPEATTDHRDEKKDRKSSACETRWHAFPQLEFQTSKLELTYWHLLPAPVIGGTQNRKGHRRTVLHFFRKTNVRGKRF